MTKTQPLFPSEVDYSKISFEKNPKKDGPKNYKVKYDGRPFDIVTGKIDVPFGISDNTKFNKEGKADYVVKYHMDLSLDISNPKIKELRNFLEKMDEVNTKFIASNSVEMFGSSFNADEVKKFKYKSLITVAIDKGTGQKSVKYNDRFSVKLPFFAGEPKFQVFDKDGNEIVFYNKETNEIDWSWAQKQMKINPIIQSEGVLVMPTGSAVFNKWKIIALRICEYNSSQISNDAFRDDVEQISTSVSDLHVDDDDDA